MNTSVRVHEVMEESTSTSRIDDVRSERFGAKERCGAIGQVCGPAGAPASVAMN